MRLHPSRRAPRPAPLTVEGLEAREVPAATPYLVPLAPGVEITPILTTGDTVGSYRMTGTPDGLGAFDNGDGTFTLLMNHEFSLTEGVAHTHNASLGTAGKGSYVDRLVISKADLSVLSGGDQIQTILDGTTFQPLTGTALNISRLCSADLPAATAFFNPATGNGLNPAVARLFLNGEETNNGRAFAHVVSGANNGTSYTLPLFAGYGGGSWENLLANPGSGDTTFVIGNSDNGTGTHFNKLMAYVGTKQAAGNEIERAGLTNGHLFQIAVAGVAAEDRTYGLGTSVTGLVKTGTFTLTSGTGTTFLRPEDGAWDPNHPRDYYFVTTDRFDTASSPGRARLWRLRFDDPANPAASGTIEMLLDGTDPGQMYDNITIDREGHVLLQEDPGNQPYVAKVWQYDIATGDLTLVAGHNPALFAPGSPTLLTQDEESSGIIDVSDILGRGAYLADVQAHYTNADPALVEGGQLLLIDTDNASATLADGVLKVQGTIADDRIAVTRTGQTVTVTVGGDTLGTFNVRGIRTVRVDGGAGSDAINLGETVYIDAIIKGGTGDDSIWGGGGMDILIGGTGEDKLTGGSRSDLLIGGSTACDSDDATLLAIQGAWTANRAYQRRVADVGAWLNGGTVIDDGQADRLYGLGGLDLFFAGSHDTTDVGDDEVVL